MIQKHAIPILEFDDNPQSVLMPTHEELDLKLPKKCIYAFLEEEIDRYARGVGADCVGEFVSATKTYPVYVINYKGEEICLAQWQRSPQSASLYNEKALHSGSWSPHLAEREQGRERHFPLYRLGLHKFQWK